MVALQSQPHYPFTTRLMIDLFNSGALPNVAQLEIEADFGYVGRIVYKNGDIHYFKGSNLDCNPHTSADIVRDKGYTKYFLQQSGYVTPPGKTFLTPLFFRRRKTRLLESNAPVNTLEAVPAYVESTLGYPCYIKPNEGSQGYDVQRCDDRAALDTALVWFQQAEYEVVLVEAAVMLPEYRIVVYGDEVICCYGRYPLVVIGDGLSSIRQLLDVTEALYQQAGRPPAIDINDHRIVDLLKRQNLTFDSVLAAGASAKIYDSANLSIGGTARDFTDALHPDWKAFAVRVTRLFNLTLCGLDLCCADITLPEAPYSILELNSTPTLSGYATLGAVEYGRVRELYRRLINREADRL